MVRARVKLPSEKDPRLKSWARTVDFVDVNHENAFAFEGEWLKRGHQHDLPIGTLVILYDETGSKNKPVSHSEIHRVEEYGLHGPLLFSQGVDWVMQIRDEVAELLEQEPPPPDLSGISMIELVNELLRRVDTKAADYDYRSGTLAPSMCHDCSCVRITNETE